MSNDINLFWAIEDLNLDAFERSFLFHIFRRGVCYQTQANIATETGMSIGKVNKLIKDLSERNIIYLAPKNGKMGWAINEAFVYSLHEQTQQNNSPDENDFHSVNTKDNKEDIRERDAHVYACEESPSDDTSTDSDPLLELVNEFAELTFLIPPLDYQNGNGEKWLKPFVKIYQATGEDFEKTRQTVKDAIEEMRAKRLAIACPRSILPNAIALVKAPSLTPQNQIDAIWEEYFVPAMTNQRLISDWPKEYKDLLVAMGGQSVFREPEGVIKGKLRQFAKKVTS